jgi:hypothetical protein
VGYRCGRRGRHSVARFAHKCLAGLPRSLTQNAQSTCRSRPNALRLEKCHDPIYFRASAPNWCWRRATRSNRFVRTLVPGTSTGWMKFCWLDRATSARQAARLPMGSRRRWKELATTRPQFTKGCAFIEPFTISIMQPSVRRLS